MYLYNLCTRPEQMQNLESRAKSALHKDPHLNPLPCRERGRAASQLGEAPLRERQEGAISLSVWFYSARSLDSM
jgi:hypothetical protein